MDPQLETLEENNRIPKEYYLASSPITQQHTSHPFDRSSNNNANANAIILSTTTAAGTAAFATTLSFSTFLQHKILRLSTGSPAPIPSLIGLTTVALASITSHVVAVKAFDLSSRQYDSHDGSSSWKRRGQGWWCWWSNNNKNKQGGLSPRDFCSVPFDFSMTSNNMAHLLRV